MHLIKSIIRKSQMTLFDWMPEKHEEQRTVHASTRHLQTGAVVQVQEHQRRTDVTDLPAPTGAQTIVHRMHLAKERFDEALMTMAGITKEQAQRVTQYYLDKKLATMDAGVGHINVKHGAYLDKDVILNAVKETEFQIPKMEVPKRKPKTKPEPQPATEYRIAKDEEPESGTKGRFLIHDKDMRYLEITNENGEIEANWPTLLEATRALNRHKQTEHSVKKTGVKGEYDAVAKSIAHPVSLIKSRKLDGKIDFNGLPISIETGKSRIRAWQDPHNGTSGMTLMKHPYGYIKGIDGTDGDELDVYVGPDRQAANVYIVNQMKAPDFTEHDEQKCMLGFPTEEAAREAYLKHYDNPRFLGSITTMPFEEFKAKVLSGNYDGKMVKSKQKCSREQAKAIGDKLKVNWDKIPINEFQAGMCHEHEHDDVTQGDPVKTGKIALEHLEEENHYYSKLKAAGLE